VNNIKIPNLSVLDKTSSATLVDYIDDKQKNEYAILMPDGDFYMLQESSSVSKSNNLQKTVNENTDDKKQKIIESLNDIKEYINISTTKNSEDTKSNFEKIIKENFNKAKDDTQYEKIEQKNDVKEKITDNKQSLETNEDDTNAGTLGRIFNYIKGFGRSQENLNMEEEKIKKEKKEKVNENKKENENQINDTEIINDLQKLNIPLTLGTELSAVTIVGDNEEEEDDDDDDEFVNAYDNINEIKHNNNENESIKNKDKLNNNTITINNNNNNNNNINNDIIDGIESQNVKNDTIKISSEDDINIDKLNTIKLENKNINEIVNGNIIMQKYSEPESYDTVYENNNDNNKNDQNGNHKDEQEVVVEETIIIQNPNGTKTTTQNLTSSIKNIEEDFNKQTQTVIVNNRVNTLNKNEEEKINIVKEEVENKSKPTQASVNSNTEALIDGNNNSINKVNNYTNNNLINNVNYIKKNDTNEIIDNVNMNVINNENVNITSIDNSNSNNSIKSFSPLFHTTKEFPSSTVAIFSSELLQISALFVALYGVMVTTGIFDLPTSSSTS